MSMFRIIPTDTGSFKARKAARAIERALETCLSPLTGDGLRMMLGAFLIMLSQQEKTRTLVLYQWPHSVADYTEAFARLYRP